MHWDPIKRVPGWHMGPRAWIPTYQSRSGYWCLWMQQGWTLNLSTSLDTLKQGDNFASFSPWSRWPVHQEALWGLAEYLTPQQSIGFDQGPAPQPRSWETGSGPLDPLVLHTPIPHDPEATSLIEWGNGLKVNGALAWVKHYRTVGCHPV